MSREWRPRGGAAAGERGDSRKGRGGPGLLGMEERAGSAVLGEGERGRGCSPALGGVGRGVYCESGGGAAA